MRWGINTLSPVEYVNCPSAESKETLWSNGRRNIRVLNMMLVLVIYSF